MGKNNSINLNRIIEWNKNILVVGILASALIALAQTARSQEIKTFTYSYGGTYVGQTKDGMRHGQGSMTWANGDKYVGGFENDRKSGRGNYTWSNGDTYEGEWQNDKMNGEGTFTYADGQKYVGKLENDKFRGEGTMTWPDGAKYVGEWKDDLRHGRGAMNWSDGTKYVGEWENDQRSGKGTLIFSSGDKYEGEFRNDEMQGQGTYTYVDGREYLGEFKRGRFADQEKTDAAPDEILIDRVVAVVNEGVITLSEVKEAALALNRDPDDPEARSQVLELMIEEKLLEQEADKQGVQVTEQEVEASIEDVKRRFNLTDEQMVEVLKQQNLTPEAFREQWKRQLLSNKLIGARLQGQIAVTEDEVRKYYEQKYGELETTQEIQISHILIPVESSEQEALNLAGEVAKLARSGDDFGELAEKYSKDQASAGRGGDLGYFKKGDLVASLEDAIENAEVGEIVGPVQSPAGYHVIKITDKKKSEASEIDEYRKEAREELYQQKVEKAIQTWLEGVKETAYIERKL